MKKDEYKDKLIFVIAILLVIFIKFLNLFPAYPNMYDSWNNVWLTWSYDYGFIRRGLLGTLIKFYRNFIGVEAAVAMRHYGWFTVFVFTSITTVILVLLIKRQYCCENAKMIIYGLLIIFFCGYGWDTWYKFYGSGDTWLIVFTIISLLTILGEKYYLSLLLVAISLLTHEAYIFMYFNVVLAGMFIMYLKNRRRKEITWIFITVLGASLLFVYLQFFSKARTDISADYIFSQHTLYTGVDYSEYYSYVIEDYLFRGKKAFNLSYGIKTEYKYALINLIFKFPIYIEIFKYWKKIINGRSSIEKIKYLAIPFGMITTLPLFIMHVDYGRWIYAISFYEIAVIIMIHLCIDDERIREADEYMVDRIKKNIFYYLGLLAYIQALGPAIQNPIHTAYEKIIYFTTLF